MLAIVMRSFKGGDEGHITAPSLLQSKACSPVMNMCKACKMFLLIQLPGSASGTLQWVLCTWSGARAFQRPSKQSLYPQTCEPLCACDSQKYPPPSVFLGISHIINSFFEILYHCFDFIEDFTGVRRELGSNDFWYQ